ncbi:hypothetical protein K0M31_017273 [Melipona bicolor]|uniref:Uncharacterized protein n=1 Tax=Melipona bicolor TaxID=60889 RepID=A0AA40G5A0_9HYME|nr:hypothetical protein K0M31_017273 [Melipona bicolor]
MTQRAILPIGNASREIVTKKKKIEAKFQQIQRRTFEEKLEIGWNRGGRVQVKKSDRDRRGWSFGGWEERGGAFSRPRREKEIGESIKGGVSWHNDRHSAAGREFNERPRDSVSPGWSPAHGRQSASLRKRNVGKES